VIRFSAALVAVAIGVLIGGIATSKLLLVYIAIVVSAVALLALAIGVVLKREVLFGEAQGLVPAGAGAPPGPPARAGERQDQSRPAAFVPPLAADPPAPLQVPEGQVPEGQVRRDRVANTVSSWEAQSARDQWSSSPGQGSTTAADGAAPDWMPGGRDAHDPAAAAAETAPSPSAVPPRTPPAPPSWFDRRTQSEASPPAVADAPAVAVPAGVPADASPADEDDDWPTRYSWLDDDADESLTEPDDTDAPVGQTARAGADDAGDHPAPEASVSTDSGPDQAPDTVAGAIPSGDTPSGDTPSGDTPSGDTLSDAPPSSDSSAGDTLPGATQAGATAPPVAAVHADADAEPEPGHAEPEPEPESAEPEPEPADSEPPFADTENPVPGDDLMAVLRGVPRYHKPDCVLIRFMPEGDIQRLSAAQAKAEGCTPCAACQPEE
jgi:hypothetical protein